MTFHQRVQPTVGLIPAFSVQGATTRPVFVGDDMLVFGDRGGVTFVDLNTQRQRREKAHQSGRVVDVAAIHADASKVFSLGEDGTLVFWNILSGKPVRSLKLPAKMAGELSVAPDIRHVSALPAGKSMTVYDLRNGRLLFAWPWASGGVFSPDSQIFACGGINRVRLWKVSTGRMLREEKVYEGTLIPFAFSPNGKRIYAVRDCQKPFVQEVEALDPQTLAPQSSYVVAAGDVSFGFISGAAASADGRFVVAGRRGESLQGSSSPFTLWDALSGKVYAEGKGPAPDRTALSATGRWLAVQTGLQVNLWKVVTA